MMSLSRASFVLPGLFALACGMGCNNTDLGSLLSGLGLNVGTSANSNSNGSGSNNANANADNDGDFDVDNANDNGFNDNDSDATSNANDNSNGGDEGNESGGASDNGQSSNLMGDAAAGAMVFSGNGCSGCHGADGSGPPNIIGQRFTSIESRARAGQNHPGGAFPNLSDQDIADLEAFLAP